MKSKEKSNGFKFICLQSERGPLIVPYKLERSARLKRMHLQIHCSDFVTLKLPMRQSEQRGTHFLQEHGEWICRTLAAQPRTPRLREHLLRYPRVSLGGKSYDLQMLFQRKICRHVIDEVRSQVDLTLDPACSSEPQLVKLLKNLARNYLPHRLLYWARVHCIKVHGISVRNQRSRWGSCSETGGISLNWRLILLSPELQDHIMLHELAHMKHFDHSPSFHRLLRNFDPRTDEHARFLDGAAARIINLGRLES